MILSSPFSNIQSVDKDMQLNIQSVDKDMQLNQGASIFEVVEQYCINEKLSTDDNLISAPDKEIPDFINLQLLDQKILLLRLYELFRGTKSHGLLRMQNLGVLNIYLNSD